MGQRSVSYSNRMIDLGADQRSQGYIHPEPCVLYGSYTALPHPNVRTIVPVAGNVGNFYLHHLPDHQEGTLIYGVQQRHPATNVAAFATSSNYYNPYVAAPSASTDFPVPVNNGLHDQLPFFGTHGIVGNSAGNFSPHMDSIRGSFKPKNVEGISGYLQCHSALAGSSTSIVPVISRAREYDVSLNGTGAWNQDAPLLYPPGVAGGYVLDGGNMGMQGYQVTSSNGGLNSFMHPPIPQGPPHHHHLPPNLQYRGDHSEIPHHPFPPTGFSLYRPHQREFIRETNIRHQNLPNIRVLPENGVSMLSDAVDHYRDMRLDIDHMSYEELLALEERIGNVTTGLSEEAIVTNLKTRTFLSSEMTPCALESVACQDHKTDFCVICQTDYNDQEKIGILECGHEYHEECIKKWLVVKNNCPICKSAALSTDKKDL